MEKEPVLVVGGTGRTGRHAVRKLLERGYPVRVLTRDAERARGIFGDGIEPFEGDVREPGTLDGPVAGAGAIVTAMLGSPSDTADDRPEMVDFGGTVNLLAAVGDGLGRGGPIFVQVSAAQVAGPEPLDPSWGHLLDWKLRAEEKIRASGLPYCIVRPAWLTEEDGGKGIRVEQGEVGGDAISREDVAEVCVRALEHESARCKTLEVYGTGGPPPDDWQALFAGLSKDATAIVGGAS